jgi:hypothetical protein
MTPAPITTVLGQDDKTAGDAFIADSLHRACPARFNGSDLSHRHRAAGGTRRHPSLASMSDHGPEDARVL